MRLLGRLAWATAEPVLRRAMNLYDHLTGYDLEREYQAQVARMQAWTDGTD